MTTSDEKTLAGRVIIAGFEGTALPDDVREDLARGALGGVIVFKRNIESAKQAARLMLEARGLCPGDRPPVTAVDQEGGRVVRLREPLTVLPPARRFGEIDDPDLTQRAGRLVGLELKACGVSLDFAPVLDVDTNPDSPVIGDRSFGRDVETVIRHAFAFARGLRDAGIHPCAKHFPGHGDATVDSHLSLPTVPHERDRLEKVEMEPFQAWARAGLGPVMTAHIVFTALDPGAPATVSKRIIDGELKGRIGFAGPVITDDLEMGAIGEVGGPAAAAVSTIRAGAHGVLVCRSQEVREKVSDALARTAASDPAFAQKLVKAAAAIGPLGTIHGPRIELGWLGSTQHVEMQRVLLGDLEARNA